ncbi:MAG: hypothetical protein ACEPOV_09220 [Hyphomicrobiales bacterium]
MMKLKLRHKSFVASLKQIVLKLKEKAILCAKQNSLSTEITVEYTQETKATYTSFPNFIDTILSLFLLNDEKKRNVTAKWFYYIITIRRTIKNKAAVSNSKAHPKLYIKKHRIYYEKLLLVSYKHRQNELMRIGQ